MKDKIKVIKEFILKHYVIFIPICLIIVLLLTYAIYNIQKLYNNYSEEYSLDGYTYFAGIKVSDEFNIKVNRDEEIISVNSNKKVDLDGIIYSNTSNKAIFLKEMSVLFIYDNYKQVKTPIYTSIEYDSANTSYKLKTKDFDNEVSNFILYDGNDLYFFPEDSILYIDKEKINLSAMSYVILNNNNSLEYYDKESDKYVIKDITNEKVIVSSNSYKIDLNEDKAIRYDSFVLLTNPTYLDNIS